MLEVGKYNVISKRHFGVNLTGMVKNDLTKPFRKDLSKQIHLAPGFNNAKKGSKQK